MFYLRITDKINWYRSGEDLYKLLTSQKAIFQNYKWCLYGVIADLKPSVDINIDHIRQQILDSEPALVLDWGQLCHMVLCLDQITSITLVASDNIQEFSQYEDTYEWKCQYPVVIEMIDLQFWEIYSSNENLLLEIKMQYDDTLMCDLKFDDPCGIRNSN